MVNEVNSSINSLINKMMIVAEIKYNKKIEECILQTFNDLTEEEKTLFINNTLNIYRLFNNNINNNDNNNVSQPVVSSNNTSDAKHYNHLKMIDFKIWLAKVFLGTVGGILIILFALGAANTNTGVLGFFNTLGKIVSLINS